MGYFTRGIAAAMAARNSKRPIGLAYEADFGFMTVLPEAEIYNMARAVNATHEEMMEHLHLPFQNPEAIFETAIQKMEQEMAIFRLAAEIYKLRGAGA